MAPGLRRIVAPNPSKYTAWGTGTYLVGDGPVAIIDPGPALAEHVEALLRAVHGEAVTHVLITHTHGDHSPAAAAIVDATGAATYGYGPHPVAADAEVPDAEEHADLAFRPDVTVRHGDVVRVGEHELECVHTPGHLSNHVCWSWRNAGALFSGDHVMGWSTSVISPPDGRISDYLDSLRLLLDRDEAVYYPTHGPPITSPHDHVRALLEHRLERERQIVSLLRAGPRRVGELVAVMYADVRPELHEPAGRSVTAHLIALAEAGTVAGPDDEDRYRLL